MLLGKSKMNPPYGTRYAVGEDCRYAYLLASVLAWLGFQLATRSCNPVMENERIWDYSG